MDPLECAIETAKEAGALLLRHLDGPLDAREKDGRRGDLVTLADHASEAVIVSRLRAAFPDAAILGEEGTALTGTADARWIVDPLDGTTNFAHGYPLFCVSIAYERAGDVVCGVVFAPVLNELYAAERGGGATKNGAPLHVSSVGALSDALVCTGFMPARYERNLSRFARLSAATQAVRRDGSAALDLAFVAAGRFDAFWEFDLNAWDVAAGALLVREAGGNVTAVDGGPLVLEGKSILGSNGIVHDAMLRELAG